MAWQAFPKLAGEWETETRGEQGKTGNSPREGGRLGGWARIYLKTAVLAASCQFPHLRQGIFFSRPNGPPPTHHGTRSVHFCTRRNRCGREHPQAQGEPHAQVRMRMRICVRAELS